MKWCPNISIYVTFDLYISKSCMVLWSWERMLKGAGAKKRKLSYQLQTCSWRFTKETSKASISNHGVILYYCFVRGLTHFLEDIRQGNSLICLSELGIGPIHWWVRRSQIDQNFPYLSKFASSLIGWLILESVSGWFERIKL